MSNRKNVPVKNIVTENIVAVKAEAPVSIALQMMKDQGFRHLPVLSEEDSIVGVVSYRDLANIGPGDRYTVGLFMSTPVESINHNETLRIAILKILEKKISCLLVTGDTDKVVGIVTTDDILFYLAEMLKSESQAPFAKIMNLPIIGDVANKLANLGI